MNKKAQTEKDDVFENWLSYFQSLNLFVLVCSLMEVALLSSAIPTHLICEQAFPIAYYNVLVQILAMMLPIFAMVSVQKRKYFNSALGYSILVVSCKIVQILTLLTIGHEKTCRIPFIDRFSVALFSIFETICIVWIQIGVKRVKKIDRERKAQVLVESKSFAYDYSS